MVSRGGVGAEGDEEDLESLHGEKPPEFGEFDVVTDEDADFARVGLEDAETVAAAHPPLALLARGGVEFALFLDGAVATAEIDDVVELVTFDERHAAGDDVEAARGGLA